MRAADLLAAASIIVNSPRPKSMCDDCGAVVEEESNIPFSSHVCNPEDQVNAGMSAAWRQLLTGKSEKDRARGYSVQ